MKACHKENAMIRVMNIKAKHPLACAETGYAGAFVVSFTATVSG